MRASIRTVFPSIYVLDLHGSSSKKEMCPDRTKDENVFDIQQGVGISFFILAANRDSRIEHADLWGLRSSKYAELEGRSLATTQWKVLRPEPPYYFFVPKDFRQIDEYSAFPSLVDIFAVNGPGVKTERDAVSIHWNLAELKQAVKAFKELSESKLREVFGLGPDSRDWKVPAAKADVIANDKPSCYTHILYRPFDVRDIWYSGQTRGFVGTPGFPVMKNMLRPKALGLLGMRQFEYDVPDYCYVFASRFIIDNRVFVSNRGIANIFPLYVQDGRHSGQSVLFASTRTNLNAAFVQQLCERLNLRQPSDAEFPASLTPEDIFHYTYAMFHSPGYRNRYAEFLKIDFPRLPLTRSMELFRALARLGEELVALHLLESPILEKTLIAYEGPASPEVEKASWSKNTVWVDKQQSIGFKGVREDVWNFHIGGYQVCEKWLKDRKGRSLSRVDIAHYQKIVLALSETIRLMKKIDEVIGRNGGLPGAFQ